MTRAECEATVAKLFTAFPHPPVEPITVEVYAEFLEPLRYEQCLEAVNILVRYEHYRPAVATILETYRSLNSKYAPKTLHEPPISEEQMRENRRRAAEYLSKLAESNRMDKP